jgi:WD40 repeat protein
VAVVRADGSGEPTLARLPNPERVALRDWLPERPWWLLVDGSAVGPATPLVWDYVAGKEVYRLPPCEPDALVKVADPTRIAVGTPGGSVRLYDIGTGRELGETPALHRRPLSHFHLLPDGRVWTAADDGSARLWGPIAWPAGFRTLSVAPGTEQIAFCPDRELMVAARPTTPPTEQTSYSQRMVFAVHDARTGRELRSWAEDVGPYRPAPLTGGRLVTLGHASPLAIDAATGKVRGPAVKVRDLATGELVSERHGGDLGILVFLNIDGLHERDGRLLYAGHHPDTSNPQGVAVWDLLAGTEVARLTGPDLAARQRTLAVTPDGRYLLSAPLGRAPGGKCVVWDVADRKPVGEIPLAGPHFVQWFTVSPDGRRVVSFVHTDAERGASEYQVYDLPSGALRHRLPGRGSSETKAFSPDRRHLAIADASAGVRVYDLDTGAELFRWQQPDAAPVRQLLFTPSGGLAVLPRSGAEVRTLDLDRLRRQLGPLGLGW